MADGTENRSMNTNTPKNPAAVTLGRLGGLAGRGASKARTREQAQAAARARWAKWREEREADWENEPTDQVEQQQAKNL